MWCEGGKMCPHFFQMAISPWRKGSWTFKRNKKNVFHTALGRYRRPHTQASFKSPALLGLRIKPYSNLHETLFINVNKDWKWKLTSLMGAVQTLLFHFRYFKQWRERVIKSLWFIFLWRWSISVLSALSGSEKLPILCT